MTYYDLLEKTERKKQKVLKEFNAAIKGTLDGL